MSEKEFKKGDAFLAEDNFIWEIIEIVNGFFNMKCLDTGEYMRHSRSDLEILFQRLPRPVATADGRRESIKVLEECMELQSKKSNDYQNPNSIIRQADYYPGGVKTILDIIHAKALRARSVIEAMESDPDYKPNFESVEDSFKDMINYASFAVAYCRGKVDGQDPDRDFLNRKK